MATNDPFTPNTMGESTSTPTYTNGGIKSKLHDATSHVKHTAADFGRSAVENIDRNMKSAASALESTASTLRSKLPTDGGKVTSAAQSAADRLESTAVYLRNHDSRDLWLSVESWARQNPGAALGGALAVGFFIGMSLNRDRHNSY